MITFALIKNNIVTNIVKAEQPFVDSLINSNAIDSAIDMSNYPGVVINTGDLYTGSGFEETFATLNLAIANRLSEFKTELQTYIDCRYSQTDRFQLLNLYILAKFSSLTNRSAYLQPMLEWTNSLIAYAASVAQSIQSKTTVEDVLQTTWDIAANTSTDPKIKAGIAIQIPD